MLESRVGGAVDGLHCITGPKFFGPAKVSCHGDAKEEKVTVDPLPPALHGRPTVSSDLIQTWVWIQSMVGSG